MMAFSDWANLSNFRPNLFHFCLVQSGSMWSNLPVQSGNLVQLLFFDRTNKKKSLLKRNILPPSGLVTHPSLGLALGLPPGTLPPHLPPGYTTSGQLPVDHPARSLGQSQALSRSKPITNQRKEGTESGQKLGNVLKCHKNVRTLENARQRVCPYCI